MSLRFYNTLSRSVEEFTTREPGKVAMYTCGPTVYARAHIGNFRTFLFTDLLRRYLKFRGYQVFSVMNITDIDDKTIRGAQQEKMSLRAFTERLTQTFFADRDLLRIEPADLYPRATDHIPEMTALVQKLIERGHAYQADGSWYYKVESFDDYGKLARLDMRGLRFGERVAADEYEKEDVRDFALWKAWDAADGDVFWETPLGKGRPGWHLECSAMSLKYLGEDFDIHSGGVDLIFPHHQNEVAQTEGMTGKQLARFWLHSEHLMINADKMSKSAGNFFTLEDLTKEGWKPREIRFALLAGHYRQQLNFTTAGLEAARSALDRLDCCVQNLKLAQGSGGEAEARETVAKFLGEFQTAMDDDLNVAEGLAALFGLVRDVNTLCAQEKIGTAEAAIVLDGLRKLDTVFAFIDVDRAQESDAEIESLMCARDEARKTKNWKEADRIRDLLAAKNIILEDRSGKTVWRRK
jgi:cysteinyl-tRNA synthetase